LVKASGEPPSAIDPPSGCRYRTRCPRAADICATTVPELRPVDPGGRRLVACHFPLLDEPPVDGSWVRRAEYPELDGCWTEATSVVEAIDQLDAVKARQIRRLLAEGKEVPVPRAPLKSGVSGLSDKPVSWFAGRA
jgi:predicted RNase H-like HicB family nuclease